MHYADVLISKSKVQGESKFFVNNGNITRNSLGKKEEENKEKLSKINPLIKQIKTYICAIVQLVKSVWYSNEFCLSENTRVTVFICKFLIFAILIHSAIESHYQIMSYVFRYELFVRCSQMWVICSLYDTSFGWDQPSQSCDYCIVEKLNGMAKQIARVTFVERFPKKHRQ